jgi:hypothetical protein
MDSRHLSKPLPIVLISYKHLPKTTFGSVYCITLALIAVNISFTTNQIRIRDSVVGIVYSRRIGQSAVRIFREKECFLFFKTSDLPLGPSSLLFYGYRCSFPGIKREIDKSLPSTAAVKSEWNCSPYTHSWLGQGLYFFTCSLLRDVNYDNNMYVLLYRYVTLLRAPL